VEEIRKKVMGMSRSDLPVREFVFPVLEVGEGGMQVDGDEEDEGMKRVVREMGRSELEVFSF
jgi:hypothetical protein